MKLKVEVLPGYLRGEVSERSTADEGRQAADALFAAQAKSGVTRMLIIVRSSSPIFRVEQYGFTEMMTRAAGIAGLRVALVSDTKELRASHEYVEVLARQRGVDIRSFRDEAKALQWLENPKDA